jgi:hypothetical protein
MIKASKLAIAIAVVCPVAVATVGESFATPVLSTAVAVKAAAPAAQGTDALRGWFFTFASPLTRSICCGCLRAALYSDEPREQNS